jgi:acyl carrier protein
MATTSEVFAFLKDLVLNVTDVEDDQVQPDAPVADLGLESMDLVELQLTVRKKFGVEVPARAFADGRLSTLGQVADFIADQSNLRKAG